MPKKLKVLITGSSGMLGVDLSGKLSGDYEVYGLDRVKRREQAKRFINCDITGEGETIRAISKVRPDIVIHTAAWTDVDACESDKDKAYRINSEGTENVALGCKAAGATLIYISTDFVFNGKKKAAYKETDRTAPLSIYADSKLLGENAVSRILGEYFIIRSGWLYGRHGKNFVDTIIEKSGREKVLKVVDDQSGCPTYTADLSAAIHELVEKKARGAVKKRDYGIYHVSNSGRVSWFEYAKAILKLCGSRAVVRPISSRELARPARRPAMSVLDNTKFRRFTGHRMRGWKDALKSYIKERLTC